MAVRNDRVQLLGCGACALLLLLGLLERRDAGMAAEPQQELAHGELLGADTQTLGVEELRGHRVRHDDAECCHPDPKLILIHS